jgi:mitogen-activated protein kinase 1/3
VERILGTGSYGSVCRALQISTGQKVAIKRVKNVFEDDVDCKRILREITLMRKMNHPSVVKIIEIIEPTNSKDFRELYIVMEYM